MNELLIGTGVGLGLCVAGGALSLAYQWSTGAIKARLKGDENKQKAAIKQALKEYEAEVSQTVEGKTKIR